MAITLGRAPQYRSRQGVPRQIGGRYADLRPSRAENRAIGGFGNLLMQRAEEMKQERDAAVVGDLYNQWRDAERSALEQIGQKKGKDAIDLHLDYDKFYNETQGKADESTENGTQQRELKDMLSRRRQQSLDSIASYEAGELQRYKQTEEVGVVANAEADVREASFDELKREHIMTGVFDFVEKNNPGLSPEALEALQNGYQSQLLFANIQSQINEDASLALEDIEKWKEQLGEGYASLKTSAEAKARDQLVEKLRDGLNFKHTQGLTPDFNAMIDEIQRAENVPDDIKDSVIGWIESQRSEFDARQSKARADTQDSEMDVIFEFIRTEKYTDAYKAVLTSTQLSEVQKFRIENIIKGADEKKVGETDETVYNEIIKKAMRAETTRDEIINLIGNGLDIPDSRIALTGLKAAEAPGRKKINKLKADAAETIEKRLLVGSPLAGFSSISKKAAYEGVKDFETTIEELPEGVSLEDAVNPESPHYIIDEIVRRNIPTNEESTNAMIEALGTEGSARKKQGETIDEYEKRNAE